MTRHFDRTQSADRFPASATGHASEPAVFLKRSGDSAALRREADALAAVRHQGVVRCRSWHRTADGAVLALDFIDGSDLETILRAWGGRLPLGALLSLMRDLADAVGAVHAAGWLHRDLKPANVRIRPDGTPVLVDFGAALPYAPDCGAAPAVSRLTHGYAAPEQYLKDGGEGPWTDVYALGAILYRALAGTPPPPALDRLRADPFPAALAVLPLPAAARGFGCLLARALAIDPRNRPPTVAEWQRQLMAAVDDDAYPPTVAVERVAHKPVLRRAAPAFGGGEPPAASGGPASPRRRRLWWPALLALAVVLAVVGGWWTFEHHLKTEWLVDAAGGGDVRTIGEAVDRVGDGGTIRVRPGTYVETVTLGRPLLLTAADPASPPVIRPAAGACIVSRASGAILSHLVLQMPPAAPPQSPPETPPSSSPPAATADSDGCVVIAGGRAVLESSRIAGGSGTAIVVRDGADPIIQDVVIDDVDGRGIVIAAGAKGEVARSTFRGISGEPLLVRGGAAPRISDNSIENSGSVVFAEGAEGTFENNRVEGSRASAVQIMDGARPRLAGNAIRNAGEAGIFFFARGGGDVEGNTIEASRLSGIVLEEDAKPRLINNAVAGSGEHGILVLDVDGAVIDRNTVRNNKGHGIAIAAEAKIELGDNLLEDNREPQLLDARRR
jgi:parallel beta-helix repeat protein